MPGGRSRKPSTRPARRRWSATTPFAAGRLPRRASTSGRVTSRRCRSVAEKLKTSNPALSAEAIGSLVAAGERRGAAGPGHAGRARRESGSLARPERPRRATAGPGAKARASSAGAQARADSCPQRGSTGDPARARCLPGGVCRRGHQGAAGRAGAHARDAEVHRVGVRAAANTSCESIRKTSACRADGQARRGRRRRVAAHRRSAAA